MSSPTDWQSFRKDERSQVCRCTRGDSRLSYLPKPLLLIIGGLGLAGVLAFRVIRESGFSVGWIVLATVGAFSALSVALHVRYECAGCGLDTQRSPADAATTLRNVRLAALLGAGLLGLLTVVLARSYWS